MFKIKKFHKFNDIMAENFYSGIQKIHTDYNNDASNIWKNKPKSATIVKRFFVFDGVGIKIATMATNILTREFKIPIKDYNCMDISPDVHVKKVFRRLGFISKDATNEELLYCARELNPEYLGIFDLSCWEIERNWCKPQKPQCKICYLDDYCPKKIKFMDKNVKSMIILLILRHFVLSIFWFSLSTANKRVHFSNFFYPQNVNCNRVQRS